MGQEEAVPATAAVVFSWEHEPGVTSTKPAVSKPAAAAVVEDARAGAGMPESPMKKAPEPARRLSVPPPPGRASLTSTRSFSRARAVRPEDDPFLAAYLACTKSGGGGDGDGGGNRTAREHKGQQRGRFAWAGLGLGLGLSCKRSNGVVEESMVRLAKLPELNPMDS